MDRQLCLVMENKLGTRLDLGDTFPVIIGQVCVELIAVMLLVDLYCWWTGLHHVDSCPAIGGQECIELTLYWSKGLY